MSEEQPITSLQAWLEQVNEYETMTWNRLPELDLYMDQVITLLNKTLAPFNSAEEKVLTPSMINNYVKDGVLPRPVQKKYNREHLVRLMAICMLKSVLTIPEVDSMVKGLLENHTAPDLYPHFADSEESALREASALIESCPQDDRPALYQLAMELALKANAQRVAASRILDFLSQSEERPEDESSLKKEEKKERKEAKREQKAKKNDKEAAK